MAETKRLATITGTTFQPGATDIVNRLKIGTPLALNREPENKYDPNAVAVLLPVVDKFRKIGYLPRGFAAELAPLLDAGREVKVVRANDARTGVILVAWDDGK